MSHTDKDKPAWVKQQDYLEKLLPYHDYFCRAGERECDLPEEPMVTHYSRETRCQWWWNYNEVIPEELKQSMPVHGCMHPRCTRCTAKKTLKRKTRRKLERELAKEMEY